MTMMTISLTFLFALLSFTHIQLAVGCVGEDGVTPCDELIPPPGICSDGNSIDTV